MLLRQGKYPKLFQKILQQVTTRVLFDVMFFSEKYNEINEAVDDIIIEKL